MIVDINTFRWMWKLVAILLNFILEYPHIMNGSRPSRHNKGKSHIEVTYCQHVLSSVTMPPFMLHYLISWHNYRDMCSIYGSNAFIKRKEKIVGIVTFDA